MSVICIGEALIDMICTDKGSSLSDGQHFLKKPGGAPTNVAAAIGALGGKVLLSAKVGNEFTRVKTGTSTDAQDFIR